MGQINDDHLPVNGFNDGFFEFPSEEEIDKLLDETTFTWEDFSLPCEKMDDFITNDILIPDNITMLIQADDRANSGSQNSSLLSDVTSTDKDVPQILNGAHPMMNGQMPSDNDGTVNDPPKKHSKKSKKSMKRKSNIFESEGPSASKKPKQFESCPPEPLPKLVIKMTSRNNGEIKVDKVPVEAELFAPTIADKVKMGRRARSSVNDQDFKTFLKDSEKLLKRPRRKSKKADLASCETEGSSKSTKVEESSTSLPSSLPTASEVKNPVISKRNNPKNELASVKVNAGSTASHKLSMPVISELLSFSSPNITTPEPEIEPGEVPSNSHLEEKCRHSTSSLSNEDRVKSSRTERPEKYAAPCRTSDPPLRYSFPETPSCSPQISPIYSCSGMSGSSKNKMRRLSSSSDSSSTSSSSSSTYSRRQSMNRKTRSEKDDCCPRCQNPPYHKTVKYNPSNNTVTDEFGRELRPHEQKIYEASCHCSLLGFPKVDRNYSRQLKHSKDQRKAYCSSRSRSRSRSRKYTRNGSRERPQRSPSSTKHSNPRERDRPIEERRVLYVGDIPCGMTETSLHDRFINFGPIEDVQIKSKYTNHIQKFFGFITFKHREDAYNAKENGNKDPLLPKFDLNFGGRRKFCNGNYTDLDGNIAKAEDRRYHDYSKKTMPMSKDLEFEELLQMEKQRIQAKGLAIRPHRP